MKNCLSNWVAFREPCKWKASTNKLFPHILKLFSDFSHLYRGSLHQTKRPSMSLCPKVFPKKKDNSSSRLSYKNLEADKWSTPYHIIPGGTDYSDLKALFRSEREELGVCLLVTPATVDHRVTYDLILRLSRVKVKRHVRWIISVIRLQVNVESVQKIKIT